MKEPYVTTYKEKYKDIRKRHLNRVSFSMQWNSILFHFCLITLKLISLWFVNGLLCKQC
ncbi:hypothetical protein BN182_1700002 [Clostridioides difficile E9]|nr:hypothetical protein BN182_1700002 [Clostridioides difficile E9]